METAGLLAEALRLAENQPASASAIERVARQTSAEAARWAFTQWELRARARSKFARASVMLFTRPGLEMASAEPLAAYHAALFPQGELVADLTAGIGADSLAFARRGPTVAYEHDPETADLLRHNLEANGLLATVLEQDCLALSKLPEYVFADPARRSGGRRTRTMAEFQPDPRALASRLASCRLAAIKLSPMLPDAELESLGPDLRFLSLGGECREALVVLGAEAKEGRRAVHIEDGSELWATGEPDSFVEEPEAWIYEADPAAIRGHCLGSLTQSLELSALGDSGGWLTGGAAVSPWLRPFRALWSGSFGDREIRAAQRELGLSVAVVKTRSKGVDPEAVRAKLKGTGRDAVLMVWASGRKLRAALTVPGEPVSG